MTPIAPSQQTMTPRHACHQHYPAWICAACGTRLGRMPAGHISTWHRGTCGWCGEVRDVTEPRDYGWPEMTK